MRRLFALFLLITILPATLLRDPPRPPSWAQQLGAMPLPEPPREAARRLLGPFRLIGAWQLTSPNTLFGGYSALVPLGGGRLLAVSDNGHFLDFTGPDVRPPRMTIGTVFPKAGRSDKQQHDIEAVTRDPATGLLWMAWEGRNAISRHGPDLKMQALARPPAMHQWPDNKGAEAMVRLADGRFVALCECYPGWLGGTDHPALVFAGDPASGAAAQGFTFRGADGFRPTDMAQLPDGRVLVLMRKLVWPFPMRFAGRIMIADPARITPGGVWSAQELARLEPPLPIDNFEGLAVERGAEGGLIVWLVSDDNNAVLQRTLLWKLALNPRDLPPR